MKCPYCLESIKKGSLKCKHCQVDLTTDEAKKKLKEINEVSTKTVVISLLIVLFIAWKGATYESGTSTTSTQDSCYSGFNGVHINGEKTLKSNLKDPNSYEHIETRYDGGHTVIKFRAKNGFGGYGIQYFGFDTDGTCSVLNWKITD